MKNLVNIISEINTSDTFAKIIEIGAGMPVSNKIFALSGASKTIYSAESDYSREAFDRKYGSAVKKAVSFERLFLINNNCTPEIRMGYYNTVLSSTFQLGDYSNNVSTHGWYSLNVNGMCKYFHISIHEPMSRENYIETIGNIGLQILHSRNEVPFTNSYVDIVLDYNLQYDVKTTLEFMSLNMDVVEHGTIFKADKTIDRLESVLRDQDSVTLYRGSFNPPTIAHVEIAENVKQKGYNPIFTISIDTYDKGIIDVSSLIKRIEMINALGYDVLILTKKLFKTNVDFLRFKFKGEIVFPLGVDTLNRVLEYYNAKDASSFDVMMQEQFVGVKFILFDRDTTNNEIVSTLVEQNKIEIIKSPYSHVSSTDVRNGKVEYLPVEISDLYINKELQS